jgi:hypothetical protein
MPLTIQTAKERAFAVVRDLGRCQIRVHISLGIVVGRNLVPFAALFMQAEPPAFPFLKVVLHLHANHCAHPRKRVDHHPDQSAIAQAGNRVDIDAIEQYPGVIGGEHRRAARLDHMLGSAHGVGRVPRHDLSGDQVVKQHVQGGQVLPDGRLGLVLPNSSI